MDIKRRWLSVEETAVELGLPAEVVGEAVREGELPALSVGDNIRINLEAALEIASGRPNGDSSGELGGTAVHKEPLSDQEIGIEMPASLRWFEDLTPGEDYAHPWPQRRKDYGEWDPHEQYFEVQDGEVGLLADRFAVKVGRSTRFERGRLTVFFKKVAVCEFMETADGDHWASLIKPDGKKVLRPGQTPPPLYWHARLEPYRDITDYVAWSEGSGVGIPRGIAVVIPQNDYRSAVHHAAARWLGKRGHNVEASR